MPHVPAVSFLLLQPEHLPQGRDEFSKPSPLAALCDSIARQHGQSPDSEALAAAREALRQLESSLGDFHSVENSPREAPGNRANDLAFHIVRVEGNTLPLLVHSTLQGLVALLDEALTGGTDLEPRQWGKLRWAFSTLFHALAGRWEEPAPAPPLKPPLKIEEGERDALRRWTRGHYVFMVLVQGLVVVLNGFRRELESANLTGARAALGMATVLMWGAESALRFTGDFTFNAYEKSVRPTLMPPVAPPGMSGLRWRDHEHLVEVLSSLRPVFLNLDPSLQQQRDEFHAAMSHAYESHKFVCSSFVGTERTSLLMTERTEKSAVEVLDHFKRVRLHLLKN
jgi:hypothetical protein